MYAVIRTGGKQYRVAEGQVLFIEKIDAEPGSTVEFDDVLMIGGEETRIGRPRVEGAKVRATVLDQTRGPKIVVFKFKRRKNYKRKKGHRQYQTVVRIQDIVVPNA